MLISFLKSTNTSLVLFNSWAGKTRSVEISKDGILFAKAEHIESAMKDFDKLLKKHLSKAEDVKSVFAEKLSVIHCEFNAIHPFR